MPAPAPSRASRRWFAAALTAFAAWLAVLGWMIALEARRPPDASPAAPAAPARG
jgi:hypothetical protein